MKAGRKSKSEAAKRTQVVTLNLTKAELDAAKKAADGRPLAAWLRQHALTSAGIQS